MRHQPSQTNPYLLRVVVSQPASDPPLPSLTVRVGDIPWMFTVYPNPSVSPENPVVIIHDVVFAIYLHLRTTVKTEEYDCMSGPKKAEVLEQFERRVGADPVQRRKGIRRIDFVNGRFRAKGLVRDPLDDNLWNVVTG